MLKFVSETLDANDIKANLVELFKSRKLEDVTIVTRNIQSILPDAKITSPTNLNDTTDMVYGTVDLSDEYRNIPFMSFSTKQVPYGHIYIIHSGDVVSDRPYRYRHAIYSDECMADCLNKKEESANGN